MLSFLLFSFAVGAVLSPTNAQAQQSCLYGQASANVNGFIKAAPGAQVTVCPKGSGGVPCSPTSPLVDISGNTIQNPVTADQNGNYVFCTKTPNKFMVQVGGTGFTTLIQDSTIVPNDPQNPVISTLTISGSLTVPNVNNFRFVDGVAIPTIQAGINALCSATPSGGTLFVPPGNYPQGATAFTGLCNSLYIQGAGRGTSDNYTAPTTITTTITTGALFSLTALSHVHISGLSIRNIGTGGGVPIQCIGCLFGMFSDLYFQGLWANGIIVSPNLGTPPNSAIWNTFRNIHHSGYQTGAAMIVLDALNTTAQVINNNLFEYMTGSGGATGFGVKLKATGGACPAGNVFINENKFSMGQDSTSLGGGTGVSADNCTFRNLIMENQTIEGNNLSISIGTGNAGFTCTGCEISANTINIPVDNSGVAGRTYITGNIGGTPQNFAVDAAGNARVNGLAFKAAAVDPGNVDCDTVCAFEVSFNTIFTLSTASMLMNRPIDWTEAAAPSGSAGTTRCYADSTTHVLTCSYNNGTFGAVPLINKAQTWGANQTNVPLVTPTIGGGSTLNLYKTVTDSPGAITVNANTCTDRGVTLAGTLATATILPTANYALEANILLAPAQSVAGTPHYRICNVTGANITLNAVSTFNLAVWQ